MHSINMLSFGVVFFLLCFAKVSYSESQLMLHSPRPLQAESSNEALIPWETPIDGFFVRTHHPVPAVDFDSWTLVIDGLVDRPLKLSVKDLQAMTQKSEHAVLECAGNGRGLQTPRVGGLQWGRGAMGNAEWGGVALSDILNKAGIKAAAKFIRVEGADKPAYPKVPGFVRSITDNRNMLARKCFAVSQNAFLPN